MTKLTPFYELINTTARPTPWEFARQRIEAIEVTRRLLVEIATARLADETMIVNTGWPKIIMDKYNITDEDINA